jgi:hypothetical protein
MTLTEELKYLKLGQQKLHDKFKESTQVMSGFSKAIDLFKVQQIDEKCTMNEASIENVIKQICITNEAINNSCVKLTKTSRSFIMPKSMQNLFYCWYNSKIYEIVPISSNEASELRKLFKMITYLKRFLPNGTVIASPSDNHSLQIREWANHLVTLSFNVQKAALILSGIHLLTYV